MFLHVCVCPQGGACSRGSGSGGSGPGGGVPAPRGGLFLVGWGACSKGEGVSSHRGGVLAPGGGLETLPHDGYCCGRYASYCNAFLFHEKFVSRYTSHFQAVERFILHIESLLDLLIKTLPFSMIKYRHCTLTSKKNATVVTCISGYDQNVNMEMINSTASNERVILHNRIKLDMHHYPHFGPLVHNFQKSIFQTL